MNAVSDDVRSLPVPSPSRRTCAGVAAWPIPSTGVDWIQTHISHVFLVGDRVFKLRKAVKLPFLDFSTRADRNADCLREVELNRRLAPSVYLGVAPVELRGGNASIGPIGESISDDAEYVVVMRKLPNGRDALSMLGDGRLGPEHLARVADLLVQFHAVQGLGSPAPWSAKAWQARIQEPVIACFETLSVSNPDLKDRVDILWKRTTEVMDSLRSKLAARRVEGRAIDGHGDLHLDHLWFEEEGAAPLIIDCIEFNEDLRKIDRASEVAFLAMDIRYRGRADLAEYFLHVYASLSDDYGLFGVVDFYSAYRALVRAKVDEIRLDQRGLDAERRAELAGELRSYIALAERLAARGEPRLLITYGLSGSGKTTGTQERVERAAAIRVRSDVERKRLYGVRPLEASRSEAGGGI